MIRQLQIRMVTPTPGETEDKIETEQVTVDGKVRIVVFHAKEDNINPEVARNLAGRLTDAEHETIVLILPPSTTFEVFEEVSGVQAE